MEARLIRAALVAASLLSLGASHRTENFIVTAPTKKFAVQVAEAAEQYRRDLAIEWLGHELPAWQDKCPVQVHVGPEYGAGGTTTFMFRNRRPFGWTMSIQGSRERIIDSVLPHEVTHTIFATHFGRPLPRWADEGACTTVEHVSEKQKQHDLLYEFLTTRRGIAFNDLFAMEQYPHDIMPLYAQGYSLAKFLIGQGGKRKFIDYVGDGMKWNNWTKATAKHYEYRSLSELQVTWLDWVRRGSPNLASTAPANEPAADPQAEELVPVSNTLAAADAVPADAVAFASHSKAEETSTDGWYARVRDKAFASRPKSKPTDVKQDNPVNEPERRGNFSTQTVTRPQPVGRPGQIILEWSRPPVYPGPAPRTASRPRTLPTQPTRDSRLVPDFGRTLWR